MEKGSDETMKKDLLSILDLSAAEIRRLVEEALRLKKEHRAGKRNRSLEGRSLGLREGADDDAVEETRDHARGVLEALAAVELDFTGDERDRRAAELGHPGLEGEARAGRGLAEEQAEGLALEAAVALAGLVLPLEPQRLLDQAPDLGRAQVEDAQEILLHRVVVSFFISLKNVSILFVRAPCKVSPGGPAVRGGRAVDQVIVSVGGYGMTHLEFWGTMLCLWSVWLVGRANS
jgi:hypothetical protein